MPFYGYIGILIIIVAEILLFLKVKLVGIYFTPIVWTGYILFVDALNFKLYKNSLIKSRTSEFLIMLPWSVICWLIFEAYNFHLKNWYYIGLPENALARTIGYVWAFATIFPAILETEQLVRPVFERINKKPSQTTDKKLTIYFVLGLAFLVIPILLPSEIASYLFALVWMGFAFLLEPVNYKLGGKSLFREFENGKLTTLLSLFLAGLICGILWEFWNYWAIGKWIYTVPIPFVGPKIFEMPLLGYLGFLPFAVEVYSMQNFLIALLKRNHKLAELFGVA
ncbi:MAG: hypothetical protein N2252_01795 [Candidatus Kryptonium sp.]|nr:hypothetical protein [Candidatus Kryptonium sp.]MCX7761552.1 hypothetical protein [Candidatus Kryptonium sp.]